MFKYCCVFMHEDDEVVDDMQPIDEDQIPAPQEGSAPEVPDTVQPGTSPKGASPKASASPVPTPGEPYDVEGFLEKMAQKGAGGGMSFKKVGRNGSAQRRTLWIKDGRLLYWKNGKTFDIATLSEIKDAANTDIGSVKRGLLSKNLALELNFSARKLELEAKTVEEKNDFQQGLLALRNKLTQP